MVDAFNMVNLRVRPAADQQVRLLDKVENPICLPIFILETAIAFCRQKQYDRVFLWTFKGLEAARHLYESLGFKLVYQQEGKQWGTTVTEQKLERGYVAYR